MVKVALGDTNLVKALCICWLNTLTFKILSMLSISVMILSKHRCHIIFRLSPSSVSYANKEHKEYYPVPMN